MITVMNIECESLALKNGNTTKCMGGVPTFHSQAISNKQQPMSNKQQAMTHRLSVKTTYLNWIFNFFVQRWPQDSTDDSELPRAIQSCYKVTLRKIMLAQGQLHQWHSCCTRTCRDERTNTTTGHFWRCWRCWVEEWEIWYWIWCFRCDVTAAHRRQLSIISSPVKWHCLNN